MPATTSNDESLTKAQIDFAQRCFQNAHELNRMVDQKANFLMAVVALITGAVSVIASAALNRQTPEDWQWYLRAGAFASLLVYLAVAFRVILVATSIFRARELPVSPNTAAPGLLFPLMLLQRYPNEIQYKDRLVSTSYAEILEDYSHQIIEVSNIYRSKQTALNKARATFGWLVWLWLFSIVLLAVTAVLLPSR